MVTLVVNGILYNLSFLYIIPREVLTNHLYELLEFKRAFF